MTQNKLFCGFYGADEPLVGSLVLVAVLRCFEHKKASLQKDSNTRLLQPFKTQSPSNKAANMWLKILER
jgi:hypothetical protein